MRNENVWAARRTANVQYGNEILENPAFQQRLLFEKHDRVIFDSAGELNLAYYFPSAVGSAFFYYGHFEIGEISFVARLLKDVPDPTILDVGANIGSHSIEWGKLLGSAQVFAFEPAPSNVDLLTRNIEENHLTGRVHVVNAAVAQESGSATFFETDDAAYSALRDTMRRPVSAKYEVAVTTIDEFVERENLQSVSLVKIDVEGTEDAVLAGAARTLERFRPLLFVEIYGGQHSNPDPEHTIATLTGLGYVPYLISDGIATPYEKHDDNFYNYLFVHNTSPHTLPAPDLLLKRALDAERLELLDKLTNDLEKAASDVSRAQRQWTELDRAVQEKDAVIQAKDAALKENDLALREKDASLQEKDAAIQAKDAALKENDRALREKDAALQEKDLKIRDLSASAQALVDQLREKDRAFDAFVASAHQLESQLKEKDALIAQLNEGSLDLSRQLKALSTQLESKESALLRLDADLREKDGLIARLSAEISEYSERFASTYAQLEEKQASLAPIYNEMELLRKAAEERLAMANELNEIAEERLAVIQSLNAQLHAIQGA